MEWTAQMKSSAKEALGWIHESFSNGGRIPPDVFEAHAKTCNKISYECFLFDKDGKVYLEYRPPSATDPYAGQLHSLGVTRLTNELEQAAWRRLLRDEIGKDANLDGPHFCSGIDSIEPERGLYHMRVHIARVSAFSFVSKANGRFYAVNEIPYDDMVKSHRELLLPIALSFARSRGWIMD
jgi:hypothetical protein